MKPYNNVSSSFMGVSLDPEGSLAVVTNNGTLELEVDSIQVILQPHNGTLDGSWNYTSNADEDDSYVFTATTADGKSVVEVTVFVSPSTASYSVAYVGSTANYELTPTVELTDIAGYIKGSLTPNGMSWKLPATTVSAGVILLGTDCIETEGVFVFQGDMSTEAKMLVILGAVGNLQPIVQWHTAIWVPDNTVLGGGILHAQEFISLASISGWRWREVLTGAVTGAAVGFLVGGPAGAIAGGLIGGGGAWVVDRVVDPNNDENNYVNSVAVGVVGGIGGGYLGPWIAGGTTAVGGGAGSISTVLGGGTMTLPEGGCLIGWVHGGRIVALSTPNTSHALLGTQAGVVVNGVAVQGAQAVSIIKSGGEIIVLGSQNFGGTMNVSQAVINIVKMAIF
jgi:hypothetical protein